MQRRDKSFGVQGVLTPQVLASGVLGDGMGTEEKEGSWTHPDLEKDLRLCVNVNKDTLARCHYLAQPLHHVSYLHLCH